MATDQNSQTPRRLQRCHTAQRGEASTQWGAAYSRTGRISCEPDLTLN